MTLGKYIDVLKKALESNPESLVLPVGLGNPHSWRGVYSELSFEPVHNITLGEMYFQARSAVGSTYTGYKGGEFTMTRDTPIHIDNEGSWSDGEHIWGLLLNLMLFSK